MGDWPGSGQADRDAQALQSPTRPGGPGPLIRSSQITKLPFLTFLRRKVAGKA